MEFFASNIRNPHMRWAYVRAVAEFLGWCAAAAGIATQAGNHSFRARHHRHYLKNGGTLENYCSFN